MKTHLLYTAQILLVAAVAMVATGCAVLQPNRAEVVSSSSPVDAGQLSRQEKEQRDRFLAAEMEEAWIAAQVETSQGDGTVLGARNGVEIITPEKTYLPAVGAQQADEMALWGTPPEAGEGDGVTLLDSDLRALLGDALENTPQGSMARWQWRDMQFMFLPNAQVYYAHHSGGRCRDGVFVRYDAQNQHRKRGLFCQKAPGSDWFLVTE